MPDPGYLIAATLVAAGITWALRALPFAAVGVIRRAPGTAYLAEQMPTGIMVILLMYTLRGIDLSAASPTLPTVISLAVTAGLHLWRGNAVLSIFAGTGVQVALLSGIAASTGAGPAA